VKACGIDEKPDTRHESSDFQRSVFFSAGITVEVRPIPAVGLDA
jgi:hypothetical protein